LNIIFANINDSALAGTIDSRVRNLFAGQLSHLGNKPTYLVSLPVKDYNHLSTV